MTDGSSDYLEWLFVGVFLKCWDRFLVLKLGELGQVADWSWWWARDVPGWSAAEEELAGTATAVSSKLLGQLRDQIRAGGDPMGEVFAALTRIMHEEPILGETQEPPCGTNVVLTTF